MVKNRLVQMRVVEFSRLKLYVSLDHWCESRSPGKCYQHNLLNLSEFLDQASSSGKTPSFELYDSLEEHISSLIQLLSVNIRDKTHKCPRCFGPTHSDSSVDISGIKSADLCAYVIPLVQLQAAAVERLLGS